MTDTINLLDEPEERHNCEAQDFVGRGPLGITVERRRGAWWVVMRHAWTISAIAANYCPYCGAKLEVQ